MRVRWGVIAAVAMVAAPLSACASDAPPTAIFLGDSDTAGVALPLSKIEQRWPTVVSETLGWREVNAGCDGSGYTQVGPGCTTTYRERVDRLLDEDPDVIVVSGGVSDLGAGLGEIEAAVQGTFVTLRETFPDATIYAVGAVGTDRRAEHTVEDLNAIVEAQATKVDAVYVDLGDPLAGRPELLAGNGRPNAEGHAVIAELTSNVIGGE
jgi:lysophospholipase L1-like esterase